MTSSCPCPLAAVHTGPPIDIGADLGRRHLAELSLHRRNPTLEVGTTEVANGWRNELEARAASSLAAARSRPRFIAGTEAIVVGDLHGDLGALWAIRAWRDAKMPHAHLVLLGDLVDRGPASASTAALAFRWWLSSRNPITVLAGNHDAAIRVSESGAPSSAIEPAEFVDWMRATRSPQAAARFGRLFVRLVEALPRWVVLPGGVLAVHGSVPHSDVLSRLGRLSDLESDPDAAADLMWLRIQPEAPRKLPNRRRQGCEMGTEDVRQGLVRIESLMSQEYGRPISLNALIRGHDHVPNRSSWFSTSDGRAVVTVNSMSFLTDDDALEPMPPHAQVAIVRAPESSGERTTITLRSLVFPTENAARFAAEVAS